MIDPVQPDQHRLESFSFGDSPAVADELAALVLAGVKTATCWAAGDGTPTHVGKRMVVLSGSDPPLAVIETAELTQRSFNEVDAAFAYDEGEGDRTLAYWREAHRRYFTRLGQFAEDMLRGSRRFGMEGVRMRPILFVLALVLQLIATFAALGQTRPRLAETSLYTKLASGCVEVDLTSWQHPTKAVFDREAKSVRRLQLCNSRVYPVFFTELLYDPRLGHNDGYVSKLVADVFTANAKHPLSIVDTLDNVIIEVGVRADRTPQFSLEEYEE